MMAHEGVQPERVIFGFFIFTGSRFALRCDDNKLGSYYMKGIVFREFIAMVEDQFSLATADHIISASNLSSDGAYTSVDTYPHQEMVDLVTHLSEATRISVTDLLHHFGKHLFERFCVIHPEYVKTHESAFELLRQLDGQIHVEVRKL